MNISEIVGIKVPVPYKSKLPPDLTCAAPDLIVGVEIETENCRNRQGWYEDNLGAIWQTKTDGSLRGNAYEFISVPAEIRILIPELKAFFEKTGFTEANYTDRCSIHVHTNITDMTVEQVGTLCLVYSIMEELLFEFVNRHKAVSEYGYSRDTNIYCVPWNQCYMNHNIVKTMFSDPNYSFRQWQKYTALNLLPARSIGTLEWRHMHGTADLDKITQWLNLIGSIVKYAKSNDFAEVRKTIKTLNDTSAYRQFYNSVFGEYLPYTDAYANAISMGVVNAKYAMMGVKDGDKPKEFKKGDKKSLLEQYAAQLEANIFPDDVEDEAQADDGAVGEAFRLPPDGGMAGQQVNNWIIQGAAVANPAVAPADPALVRNRPIPRQANRRVEVRAQEVPLTYPLQRGRITNFDARGNQVHWWGVRDGVGRLWKEGGDPIVGIFQLHEDFPGYSRGIRGADFWRQVDANWRPANQGVNL